MQKYIQRLWVYDPMQRNRISDLWLDHVTGSSLLLTETTQWFFNSILYNFT